MSTKLELVAATATRYREAPRAEETKILDEFVAVSGFHRKPVIRPLRQNDDEPSPTPIARKRQYGERLREALIVLWETSDRIRSKRLKPLVPDAATCIGAARSAIDRRRLAHPIACRQRRHRGPLYPTFAWLHGVASAVVAGLSSAVRREVPISEPFSPAEPIDGGGQSPPALWAPSATPLL